MQGLSNIPYFVNFNGLEVVGTNGSYERANGIYIERDSDRDRVTEGTRTIERGIGSYIERDSDRYRVSSGLHHRAQRGG